MCLDEFGRNWMIVAWSSILIICQESPYSLFRNIKDGCIVHEVLVLLADHTKGSGWGKKYEGLRRPTGYHILVTLPHHSQGKSISCQLLCIRVQRTNRLSYIYRQVCESPYIPSAWGTWNIWIYICYGHLVLGLKNTNAPWSRKLARTFQVISVTNKEAWTNQ